MSHPIEKSDNIRLDTNRNYGTNKRYTPRSRPQFVHHSLCHNHTKYQNNALVAKEFPDHQEDSFGTIFYLCNMLA